MPCLLYQWLWERLISDDVLCHLPNEKLMNLDLCMTNNNCHCYHSSNTFDIISYNTMNLLMYVHYLKFYLESGDNQCVAIIRTLEERHATVDLTEVYKIKWDWYWNLVLGISIGKCFDTSTDTAHTSCLYNVNNRPLLPLRTSKKWLSFCHCLHRKRRKVLTTCSVVSWLAFSPLWLMRIWDLVTYGSFIAWLSICVSIWSVHEIVSDNPPLLLPSHRADRPSVLSHSRWKIRLHMYGSA